MNRKIPRLFSLNIPCRVVAVALLLYTISIAVYGEEVSPSPTEEDPCKLELQPMDPVALEKDPDKTVNNAIAYLLRQPIECLQQSGLADLSNPSGGSSGGSGGGGNSNSNSNIPQGGGVPNNFESPNEKVPERTPPSPITDPIAQSEVSSTSEPVEQNLPPLTPPTNRAEKAEQDLEKAYVKVEGKWQWVYLIDLAKDDYSQTLYDAHELEEDPKRKAELRKAFLDYVEAEHKDAT